MKAAVYYGIRNIRVEEIPLPETGPGELLVKVHAAAICGTDLRIYNYGHFKIREGERRILGHELSGEIVETGSGAEGFKKGDRVSVAPNIGCGVCPNCRRGLNQLCPGYDAFGISLDGGFAEYMKIPRAAIVQGNVVKLPEGISPDQAVLVEPLSCCFNSWRALGTRPGDTVLIFGAGPIGALHVMINRLAGATKIIVADISAERLRQIREYGADEVINSSEQDPAAEAARLTEGQGPSVVITACSVPAVQQQALEIAGVEGRINFFGGMPKGKEAVTLNTNLVHYKQLKVLGTTGSTINDYLESMRIAASGRLPLEKLVSRRFRIDEINDAFQYAAGGTGMKTFVGD
ncbi:MAG: zinc-dependent dehydrogenase [Treponema sp.]|jgi:threonine dehydrogenase-like Zn-dependent dehydrogenase|nr:zinc-dependent dehydrogenase [Treponema sp.]